MNRNRIGLPADRRVQFMATCLCDAFYDDVARASVEVLESLGCNVEFPVQQTCCGQPAFNGGDWSSSRKVARHTIDTFSGSLPVVIPSASCTGMLRHGALLAFEKETDLAAAEELGSRTWELADFIVNALGVHEWPGRYEATLAFHRSCHSRGSASGEAAVTLLRSIRGLNLVEFGEPDQCCGFGGTFAVAFPHVSKNMGLLKLEHVRAVQPAGLVSGDMSCLMHLAGLAEKEGKPLRAWHLAQILRDAILGGPQRTVA